MRKSTSRIARYAAVAGVTVIAVALTASFVLEAYADKNDAEGTWVVNVTYPPEVGLPPFAELLVFHKGGTLSETNAILHANSQSPDPRFNYTGSDGYGSWQSHQGRGRHGGRMVEFTLTKLVFDGTSNLHAGYLRVDSEALIMGDRIDSIVSTTQLILFNPDPEGDDIVIPFLGAVYTGTRISL